MKKDNINLLFIPIALAFVLTIPFYLTNLDINFQLMFFKNNDWYMQNNSIVKFLYSMGPVPAIFSAVIALSVIILSYFVKTLVKYRRNAIFVFLLMVVGPGLFVNAIFKEYWGRPRPREIINFGGTEKYVPPLKIGKFESLVKYEKMDEAKKGAVEWDVLRNIYKIKGKYNSFPAGHASVGFFMMYPFFLLYKRNRRLAYISLITGIIYGFSMGIGRNIQGGHFLSDVIWAGFMVYFSGIGLYFWLKYNKDKE